ncbi:MAG: ParB N-terminal domain-containing protein [Candidatus Buchananbacteria bacterium]
MTNKKAEIAKTRKANRRPKGQHHRPGREQVEGGKTEVDVVVVDEVNVSPNEPELLPQEDADRQADETGEVVDWRASSVAVMAARNESYQGQFEDEAELDNRWLNPQTRGLGWWSEALVFDVEDAHETNVGDIIHVNPDNVLRDPNQPRKIFDPYELRKLAVSIVRDGQQESAQVYRNPDELDYLHPWVQLNGQRRLEACAMAQVPYCVQVVKYPGSPIACLIAQVLSNENSVSLTDQENAEAVGRLSQSDMSAVDIARIFGKSTIWVYQHLSFLKLDPSVQSMISASIPKGERLAFSVVIKLADLPPQDQINYAKKLVGRPGFEMQEIIRGAVKKNNAMRGKRNRRPNDDLVILSGICRRAIRYFEIILAYEDDRFNKMFSALTPKTYSSVAAMLKEVIHLATRIGKRMCLQPPRGVKIVHSGKSPVSAASEPTPQPLSPRISPPELTDDVDLAEYFAKLTKFVETQTQALSAVNELDPNEGDAILRKAMALSLRLAVFRRELSRILGVSSAPPQ